MDNRIVKQQVTRRNHQKGRPNRLQIYQWLVWLSPSHCVVTWRDQAHVKYLGLRSHEDLMLQHHPIYQELVCELVEQLQLVELSVVRPEVLMRLPG